ncbi:hypothetical protein CNR22_02550 [Sphingobacteriaceae bacterium]|nr:hypothetical protein CNR22_02550 [Sphingobacteriaceae bacterium]
MITGKRKAISNFIRQFATVVDSEKRVYKIEQGLFGIFHWGSFQPLPKIEYVLIFRSFFAKCEACAFDAGDDNPNAYFQVSLVYRSNRRIILHETKKKQEAFELATETAKALKTKICDSATIPGKGTWHSIINENKLK